MMPTYPRLPENSDWEKLRNQSKWHFDYTKTPYPGEDSYTYVGKFVSDFNTAIEYVKATKKYYHDLDAYSGNLEEDIDKFTFTFQNLSLIGANPYIEAADCYLVEDIPMFQSISDMLGLKESIIRLDIQRPGQIIPAHIDELGSLKKRLSRKNISINLTNQSAKRFAIMLDDWKLGHVFQLGNAVWHQWSAGDCITWDWENIPHCTCNSGYWDRPMLQITGLTTQKTFDILNIENKIFKLEV